MLLVIFYICKYIFEKIQTIITYSELKEILVKVNPSKGPKTKLINENCRLDFIESVYERLWKVQHLIKFML